MPQTELQNFDIDNLAMDMVCLKIKKKQPSLLIYRDVTGTDEIFGRSPIRWTVQPVHN